MGTLAGLADHDGTDPFQRSGRALGDALVRLPGRRVSWYRRRAWRVIGGIAAIAVIAGVALLALGRLSSSELGVHLASAAPPPPPPPTQTTLLPTRQVTNGTSPLAVTLNGPIAPTSPHPWFEPHVNGTWATVGNAEVFTPASTLEPCTKYQMWIPADTIATGHSRLGRHKILHLTVACPDTRALQFALSRLNYMPERFVSAYGIDYPLGPETRKLAAEHAFDAPHGNLVPRYDDAPPATYGDSEDPVTTGAVEIFQADHNIPETGVADARTWASILAALTDYRKLDKYTWVTVTETLPETLEVHHNNHVLLSSPANTGVPGAPTAQGIFPIFERFVSTTMTGTNPDGSHYSDPGVPWVNYFNGGDAVHGFDRPGYGYPQSDGCVELPPATAGEVYPLLAIGDIVWVQ